MNDQQNFGGGQYPNPQQPSYQQPQVQVPPAPQQPQQPQQPQMNVIIEQPQPGAPLYPMTETDRTLRLIAFIFMVLSLVATCWLIIPLAWMIPMTVISWGIYKGTKPNGTAFGVCTLLFASLVAGICLLISTKNK